jgi:CysZ protein
MCASADAGKPVNAVMRALLRAFRSLMHPKLLLLSVLPTLVALIAWGSLALMFWAPLNVTVSDWLRHTAMIDWMLYAARVLFQSDIAGFVPGLSKILILVTLWPLVQATALLLTAVFVMPMMVDHVAKRSYAGLERRRGGTFARSVLNGFSGLLVFLVLWMFTLPLWLVPGVVLVLPLLLSSYLNQRMFCYDALAGHADAEELHVLTHGYRFSRYALGGVLGIVNYIPLLGWFAQVFIGLAFIHWGLGTLVSMRAAKHLAAPEAETHAE